jgi:hypothetical protein
LPKSGDAASVIRASWLSPFCVIWQLGSDAFVNDT